MKTILLIGIIYLFTTLCMQAQNLYLGDFEDNVSWWGTWGGTTYIADNPSFEGNASLKVLKYEPDSLWRGISIYFINPPFNKSHKTITLYAYTNANTSLQLGLPSDNAEDTFFVRQPLSGGDWRYVEFDISSLKVYTYKYLIIQTVERTTYYFDNIVVEADPAYVNVEKQKITPIIICPNPAKNYIKVSNLNSPSALMKITNYAGQVILQKNIENDEMVSIKSLQKGFYYVHVQGSINKSVLKLIKE